ncbi:MAG: ABC transporter permease [Chloroflexi bacterium]|nr:ABC transporter permease [Chloroflexota bacterium]
MYLGLAHKPVELFQYRELVKNLVIRDLKVRYKSSVLGFFWSLLNPLLMMVVFYVVFTVLMPRGIPNFPLFILSALLPWNFFANSVTGSLRSIVDNANVIKKVNFPHEVLPISVVLANLVNFLLSLPILVILMIAFRAPFTLWLLYLPVIIAIEVVFLVGLAITLSCLNVFFRDTQVIVEVMLMAWFFFTPIFYRMEDLAQTWNGLDVRRLMYIANPMASITESFRLIFYSGAPPDPSFLFRTFVTSCAVLAIGYLVFLRAGRSFVEEL